MKKQICLTMLLSIMTIAFTVSNTSCMSQQKLDANKTNEVREKSKNSGYQYYDFENNKVNYLAKEDKLTLKNFLGRSASLLLGASSVALGFGAIHFTNMGYKKADSLKGDDKKGFAKMKTGVLGACVPLLGMYMLDLLDDGLKPNGFNNWSTGYCIKASLKFIGTAAVAINCGRSLLKAIEVIN